MSDDLRTRIAAVLQARDQAAVVDIDDPLWVEHASYEELADAVIAELGLASEGKPNRGGGYRTRYVTDWKADDDS